MKQAVRQYTGKNADPEKVGQLIKDFFDKEKFKTQIGVHPKGVLIQAQKGGIFRSLLAMDRAFTVTVEGDADNLTVKIGVGKWIQDLGVAALEAIFLTELVVFVEVPEALWTFEIEHQLWHYLESQLELGIQ